MSALAPTARSASSGANVPYSQTRYYAGYRTDCSGFVSMCWALPSSYNTRTLYRVSYPITADDLHRGAWIEEG